MHLFVYSNGIDHVFCSKYGKNPNLFVYFNRFDNIFCSKYGNKEILQKKAIPFKNMEGDEFLTPYHFFSKI